MCIIVEETAESAGGLVCYALFYTEANAIMKKIISILLTLTLIATLFAGCGNQQSVPSSANDTTGKVKVVTTVFPVYDWAREILGQEAEHVDLTLLLKNGVDLHSYQPSAEDLAAIADADVFVYVGGHSDTWVADALKNESNPNRIAINLFDVLGDSLKPLELSEGMEHHHDHGDHDEHDHDEHDHDEHQHDEHQHDEHEHEEHEHHHHDGENDENVWLSLTRAKAVVQAMAEEIAKADPAFADIYLSNAKNYEAKFDSLDQAYRDTVNSSSVNTLVFADRFPFFYMTDDYGLKYYAAFTGCSAESEASFETVTILAHKIDELSLNNVINIENRTHKIPETVIESTKNKNQNILVMNSLQSVTKKQIMDGMTYLDVMKSNLDVLKTALQ